MLIEAVLLRFLDVILSLLLFLKSLKVAMYCLSSLGCCVEKVHILMCT